MRGIGEDHAFSEIADIVRRRSADLAAPDALAHMDPPPPDIAAKLVGLNAAHNQNLLHPDPVSYTHLTLPTIYSV